MGEIEKRKSSEDTALEIQRAILDIQNSALPPGVTEDIPAKVKVRREKGKKRAGGSISYSRLQEYEMERVETLRLYLHLIGVGANPDETKAKIQEKIFQLLVEKKESIKITELEKSVSLEVINRDVFEPVFGKNEYAVELYRDEKKKVIVQYYVSPETKEREHDEGFYVYTPSGLHVVRASQSELGSGVLGVAYIGLGLIKILDTLQGLDYTEVLKHEVLHHQYPHESERAIRMRTMNELPFPTSYQYSY